MFPGGSTNAGTTYNQQAKYYLDVHHIGSALSIMLPSGLPGWVWLVSEDLVTWQLLGTPVCPHAAPPLPSPGSPERRSLSWPVLLTVHRVEAWLTRCLTEGAIHSDTHFQQIQYNGN